MMNKPIVNFLIISLMSVVLILSGCSNESAETDTSKKQENTSHEATNTLNLEYSDSFSIEYIDGQVKKKDTALRQVSCTKMTSITISPKRLVLRS